MGLGFWGLRLRVLSFGLELRVYRVQDLTIIVELEPNSGTMDRSPRAIQQRNRGCNTRVGIVTVAVVFLHSPYII